MSFRIRTTDSDLAARPRQARHRLRLEMAVEKPAERQQGRDQCMYTNVEKLAAGTASGAVAAIRAADTNPATSNQIWRIRSSRWSRETNKAADRAFILALICSGQGFLQPQTSYAALTFDMVHNLAHRQFLIPVALIAIRTCLDTRPGRRGF